METTMPTFDIITSFIIIGILTVIFQEIKIIISIIKINNTIKNHIKERKIFKKNKIFICVFIAFVVTTITFLFKLNETKFFALEILLAAVIVSLFRLNIMKKVI